MLLVLDNYDSFTYNLVQYLGELGAVIEIYRNDVITVEEIIKKKPKGIVLSPGPGRPEKAGIMNNLIDRVQGRIPILGVCLGHQAIAQVHGAKIDYAPILMHGKTSAIYHDSSSLFKGLDNPFIATRYHSLIVEKKTLSKDFKITAQTKDKIIMGIQHKTWPLYGVQFHPESILTIAGKDLLNNFLKGL